MYEQNTENTAQNIVQTEQTEGEKRKRDPNAPKRKYELKHITREQRVALCRKAATKRAIAARSAAEGTAIRKDSVATVVKVTRETKRDIELLAVKMNLSYGEVVQIAMENLKEALGN